MSLQITPFAGLWIILAVLSAVLAVLAWHRRSTPGAAVMAALMLALAGGAMASALELISSDLITKLSWVKIQYVAILAAPTLWLIFVLIYSGRGDWLTPGKLAALALPPILFLVLIWTTGAQGALYRDVTLDTSGAYPVLRPVYGPLFWVQAAYNYALGLVATVLVLWTFRHSGALRRAQSGVLLVIAMASVLGTALYIGGFNRSVGLDISIVLFFVPALAAMWGMYRYRFLDLVPVARNVLVEAMSEGVVVIDIEQRVVDLNVAAEQMVGRTASRAIGSPASDILPGWSTLAPLLNSQQAAQATVALARDGAIMHLEIHASPLHRRKHHLIGWLAVYRDVTARVRAEEAERKQRLLVEGLRDALEALTSTLSIDEVLDRILELTAVVVPHETGNFMLIEDGWAYVKRTRGYGDDALNRRVLQLKLEVMETPNLRRMYLSRQPLAIKDTAHDPDWIVVPGMEYLRSYAAAPIIVKGQVIGFLNLDSQLPGSFIQSHAQALQAFADEAGIAIENARLYTSLQESNAKLSQALRAREEAIQNVSHELRTPLTLMLGYVEFIESGAIGPVTSAQANALRIVAQQGRRLQFIFNSLLTLQTFQQQDITLFRVDSLEWLLSAVEGWRDQTTDCPATIRLVLPDHLPPVMGAADYLDLVLGNLLDNAVKFGGKGRQITVSARDEGETVVFSVTDQGIGIPPDQLETIFERFYQVDGTSTRRHGGMGIGLALCKAIVQAHSGRIWGESAGPGQGSTFSVALPIAPPFANPAGT